MILTRVFVFLAPRLFGANLVYGTLGAILVGLTWLDLVFTVILLGAAWVRERSIAATRRSSSGGRGRGARRRPSGSALAGAAAAAEPGGRRQRQAAARAGLDAGHGRGRRWPAGRGPPGPTRPTARRSASLRAVGEQGHRRRLDLVGPDRPLRIGRTRRAAGRTGAGGPAAGSRRAAGRRPGWRPGRRSARSAAGSGRRAAGSARSAARRAWPDRGRRRRLGRGGDRFRRGAIGLAARWRRGSGSGSDARRRPAPARPAAAIGLGRGDAVRPAAATGLRRCRRGRLRNRCEPWSGRDRGLDGCGRHVGETRRWARRRREGGAGGGRGPPRRRTRHGLRGGRGRGLDFGSAAVAGSTVGSAESGATDARTPPAPRRCSGPAGSGRGGRPSRARDPRRRLPATVGAAARRPARLRRRHAAAVAIVGLGRPRLGGPGRVSAVAEPATASGGTRRLARARGQRLGRDGRRPSASTSAEAAGSGSRRASASRRTGRRGGRRDRSSGISSTSVGAGARPRVGAVVVDAVAVRRCRRPRRRRRRSGRPRATPRPRSGPARRRPALGERRRQDLLAEMRRAGQAATLGRVPAVAARVLAAGHAEVERRVEGVELLARRARARRRCGPRPSPRRATCRRS